MTDGPQGGAPEAGDQGSFRFAERMTGVETLMWRLGRSGTRFQATMSLVVTLEGRIDRRALEDRLGALCEAVPRLRDRVRESALGVVSPSWEPDPAFALEHHLHETPGSVWSVASSVVATPFQEHRPPWRVVVVSSAGSGADAVVLHLHHSYTDGLGGMRLLAELFDLTPDAPPVRRDRREDPDGREPAPEGVDALLLDLESEVKRAAGLCSRAIPWAARTIKAAHRDPAGLLQSAADIAASLQAPLAAAVGPASPALSPRSDGVVLMPLMFDFDRLVAASRRLGLTVNDIYVAGLLGGLERYHAKFGAVPASLRLGVPISSRDSATDMRNQVFGAVVRAPLGSLEFEERARFLHEAVDHGRRQPLAPFMEDLAATAVRLPGGVTAAASALSSLELVASNVTGPAAPMWLTGVPVEAMIPFGPRSGAAVNATLLSYNGTAGIGLNVDPAAVVDPALLVDCLDAAFGDALVAQGPAGEP